MPHLHEAKYPWTQRDASNARADDLWAVVRTSFHQFHELLHLGIKRIDHLFTEAEQFGKRGWPLSPDLDVNELAWIVDSSSQAPLDEIFVFLYEHENGFRLNRLFERLAQSPRMAKFAPMIKQAQDALSREHYALIVPAMVSALEGAMFPAPDKSTKVRDQARRLQASQVSTSIERVIWQTIVDFVDILFECSDFTGPEPRLNRHWTVHGRAAADWNRCDAIQLLHGLRTIDAVNAMVRTAAIS